MLDLITTLSLWLSTTHYLVISTLISLGINWILFMPAYVLQTEKFYDLAGSSIFIILTVFNYTWNHSYNTRQNIQATCVVIWAFRLGLFLFLRVLRVGKDRRFDKIKPSAYRFWAAWTLQGIWVLLTLLPTLLVLASHRQRHLGWRDFVGWGIWAIGFGVEVMADFQKAMFRNNPANKDKFISSGLWSLSRHPNYMGEILLWFGLYVSASSTFTGVQYLSVLCPVFNYILLMHVSGVPLLEKSALRKWGKLPLYQEYLKITPVLWPFSTPGHHKAHVFL